LVPNILHLTGAHVRIQRPDHGLEQFAGSGRSNAKAIGQFGLDSLRRNGFVGTGRQRS
jgi:hypothetical protein